jgi:hypothetical protein
MCKYWEMQMIMELWQAGVDTIKTLGKAAKEIGLSMNR